MKSAILIGLQLLAAASTAESLATASNDASSSVSTTILRSSRDYHLLEEVPHDASSFTQGLTYFDGHIYEGTGLEQKSLLMRHDPTDRMKTLDKVPLTPTNLFGEGISHYYVWRDGVKEHRLIQLTWKHKVGKVYSLPDMEMLNEFTFETVTGEGWGITFVPHRGEFYVSDGSEYLMVWDAETLEEKRRLVVTFSREPGTVEDIKYVNELEFVCFDPASNEDGQCRENGECSDPSSPFTPAMRILANVWYQDVLISIDPSSGQITRVYDLTDIYPLEQRQKDGADCLNGISVTGTANAGLGLEVWVTGKLWPKMYRIQLID